MSAYIEVFSQITDLRSSGPIVFQFTSPESFSPPIYSVSLLFRFNKDGSSLNPEQWQTQGEFRTTSLKELKQWISEAEESLKPCLPESNPAPPIHPSSSPCPDTSEFILPFTRNIIRVRAAVWRSSPLIYIQFPTGGAWREISENPHDGLSWHPDANLLVCMSKESKRPQVSHSVF